MKRVWRPLIVLLLSILKIPDGWYRKSLSLSSLDRDEEALEALDRALALDPQDADFWSWRGYIFGFQARDEEALKALGHAQTLTSGRPFQIVQFLEKHFSKIVNRSKKILASFDHALTLDPNNATAWCLKGICFRNLDRDEEALEALDHALTLDPNNAAAWYLKGVSLIDIDQEQNKRISVDSEDIPTSSSSTNIILRKVDVLRALTKEKEARKAESKAKKHGI